MIIGNAGCQNTSTVLAVGDAMFKSTSVVMPTAVGCSIFFTYIGIDVIAAFAVVGNACSTFAFCFGAVLNATLITMFATVFQTIRFAAVIIEVLVFTTLCYLADTSYTALVRRTISTLCSGNAAFLRIRIAVDTFAILLIQAVTGLALGDHALTIDAFAFVPTNDVCTAIVTHTAVINRVQFTGIAVQMIIIFIFLKTFRRNTFMVAAPAICKTWHIISAIMAMFTAILDAVWFASVYIFFLIMV
jgi:hypothetical protein